MDLSSFKMPVKKGQTIFKEGDEGEEMYFIHSGKVRLEKNIAGETTETLATMEKGDFFGEMAVLDQVLRTATAVVEEDGELLKIDSKNFEKLLSANIEIAIRMIRKYAARLRESNQKLEAILQDRHEMNHELKEILDSARSLREPSKSDQVAGQLVSETGSAFKIYARQNSVGRRDPVTGITPDVDLTDVDTGRSVSRKHARISYSEGTLNLAEEVGVANGTILNGETITPGSTQELKDGDRLQLGDVVLTFKKS